MPTTIVIGSGWSGLSCAYYLTQAGHQVTVLEAAPQSGGRARSISLQDHILDNGQHICIGAYQSLRAIIKELGLDEKDLFSISAIELIIHGEKTIHLKLHNLMLGILKARGISLADKYCFLKFCYQIRKLNFKLAKDCTVLELLKNYQQSDFLIKYIWEPLALAAMTTSIQQASAQVFLRILDLSFSKGANNSQWYLPATDLSQVLPTHIENYLHAHGSRIVFTQAIKNIELLDNRCIAVHSNSQKWQADNIVLAAPPWQAKNLIAPHLELANSYQALINFSYQPITTIYYAFSHNVELPHPLIGVVDGTCQWIFDRSFAGQPYIISAVISGTGTHQSLNQEQLATQVLNELRAKFSHLDTPIWQRVINEKRAAFTCDVAIQTHRPQPRTKIANLWLTGDYLQTNLPATLEGAVISGKRTAEEIISPRSNQYC